MNVDSQYELQSIINELSSIISELDSISADTRSIFTNIGNNICADTIDKVNENYRNALQRLYNVDVNDVISEF